MKDDMISRQAALDALDRLEYTPGEWATSGLTMCKDAIKALPSATDTNVGGNLIDRQAAISEIMEDLEDRSLHDDPNTPEDYAEGYDEGIRNAAAIVLQMPSAQPTCTVFVPVDDCISRQAAIDALEKVADMFPWRVPGNRDTYDRYNEAWNDAIGRAEMEIENMPSAQLEIIRCKDCKYNPNPPECGNADCVLFYGMTDQMGFCHHGERREQE